MSEHEEHEDGDPLPECPPMVSRDLKSILVTSVLQLEEIDVGLYR